MRVKSIKAMSSGALVIAVSAWLGAGHAAKAWSLLDLLPSKQTTQDSDQSKAADATVPEAKTEAATASEPAIDANAKTDPLGKIDADEETGDALAYASQLRSHHLHRLLRHARVHKKHPRGEEHIVKLPTLEMTPADVVLGQDPPPRSPPAAADSAQTTADAPGSLHLALSGEGGRDPFEQLMSDYYWSRLNHTVAVDQIFAPVDHAAEGGPSSDSQEFTIAMVEPPVNEHAVKGF
jgi:hypothetical protein